MGQTCKRSAKATKEKKHLIYTAEPWNLQFYHYLGKSPAVEIEMGNSTAQNVVLSPDKTSVVENENYPYQSGAAERLLYPNYNGERNPYKVYDISSLIKGHTTNLVWKDTYQFIVNDRVSFDKCIHDRHTDVTRYILPRTPATRSYAPLVPPSCFRQQL